jgi:hypothetical protein
MTRYNTQESEGIGPKDVAVGIVLAMIGVGVLIALIWGCCALGQIYGVWSQSKEGEAELARAESNRQIKTLEAKAFMDSASYRAQAEIIQAEGVATANKIIGDSLNGNESYLRYLWIQSLQHGESTVVYVPTEANLPILEAGRRP